ncbi:TetR/AcrR family transcriptional regulator [Sphingomonas tagetis]|nr:TetR/AcrR family transcriptional regulator [Sphingomonas tagetis]
MLVRDAAARIFADRGYHGASVQEVADAVGFTKAAIYYYYRSKEAMLADILDHADREITAILDEEKRRDLAPLQLIGAVVAAHVTWYLRHPTIAKVAFRDWGELTGAALASQVERRQRYSRFLRDTLDACVKSGSIAPGNVRLMANFINGAVAAANVWFNPGGPDTPETVGTAFGEMAVAVASGPGARSRKSSAQAHKKTR